MNSSSRRRYRIRKLTKREHHQALKQRPPDAFDQPPVVSTGRRLDVARAFTLDHELPDLSILVISKGTGECGSFYTRHFDPAAERAKVFAFDWSKATRTFDGFVTKVEKAVKPRKRRKEAEALGKVCTT